jgi:ferredoxin
VIPARLRVDPIACDGRGLCAEALPELITLDDWGFPITSGQPVPAWLLGDARETARACPKLALRLGHLRSPQPARRGGSQPRSGL